MIIAVGLSAGATQAFGHGSVSKDYRTEIISVTPADLPVDVRMSSRDEIRFENDGNKVLELCGYETRGCTPWVKIGPDGVYVDTNSEAYFINSDGSKQGAVPEGAGSTSEFERVRSRPAFYTYHDHRVHWMGTGNALPPGVDSSDPDPQKVYDGEVHFRYGGTDGVVKARLFYVGGQTWLQKYGEYLLLGAAVLFMLGFFAFDARRRRRRRAIAGADGSTGVVESDAPPAREENAGVE